MTLRPSRLTFLFLPLRRPPPISSPRVLDRPSLSRPLKRLYELKEPGVKGEDIFVPIAYSLLISRTRWSWQWPLSQSPGPCRKLRRVGRLAGTPGKGRPGPVRRAHE